MAHRELRRGVFQTTTIIAVALLLLILFVTVAYFFTIPGEQRGDQSRQSLTALQEQRAIWEQRRPAAFRYVVERRCACADALREPYVATETRGERRAEYRRPAQSREGVPGMEPPGPVWINDLFEIAERSLEDGGQVDIAFDARFSYPASLRIEDDSESGGLPIEYEVIDFEVLDYSTRSGR